MAIGRQQMSGVNVPRAARPSGSGAKDAAVVSGLASLIQTGAGLYGAAQQREQAAQAQQQAQEQAVDIESSILDVEKSMLEQSMNFEQLATSVPGARDALSFDADESGDLSADEKAAQAEYNKKRDRILNSSLDPRRRQMLLIDTQQKLMAKYPGALESIRKKLDATRDRVSIEDQLFASPDEYESYKELYGPQVTTGEYAKFRTMRAYQEEQASYGEVTMDNLTRHGNAIADVDVLQSTQRLFTRINKNPSQYRDPKVFADEANNERERLVGKVLQLRDAGMETNAAPEKIQQWADGRITAINEQFDRFIEAKDPLAAVKNANQMNEQLIENRLMNLAPATMAFIGKDASGQTMSQLMTLMNSGAENREQKLKSFLGPEFQVDEAERVIKFFSALQDPETRRNFLVQSPFAAGNLFAATGANGGDESNAKGWNDSFQSAIEKYGAGSPEVAQMLTNLSNPRAAEGIIGQMDTTEKNKLKSRVEGVLRIVGQRTSLGHGEAGGPKLARDKNGLPVVIVQAMTGGGRDKEIRSYPDKEATRVVQGMYQLYSNHRELGDPDELLEQVFSETIKMPQQRQTQEQPSRPETQATQTTNMVEEIEDFVAARESLATLDSARNRRIQKSQREAIKARYDIDDSRLDSVIQQLDSGTSSDEIVKNLDVGGNE